MMSSKVNEKIVFVENAKEAEGFPYGFFDHAPILIVQYDTKFTVIAAQDHHIVDFSWLIIGLNRLEKDQVWILEINGNIPSVYISQTKLSSGTIALLIRAALLES